MPFLELDAAMNFGIGMFIGGLLIGMGIGIALGMVLYWIFQSYTISKRK